MRYYLIVDLGTGNTRVALTSSDGRIMGMRTFTNAYYRDEHYEDAQYFLPQEWQERILDCCQELCEEFPGIQIDAVSAAGARQSFVLLDCSKQAFLGLPNMDNRGAGYLSEITQKAEIYRLSGKWVTGDFGAAKLLGLRKKYPEVYKGIDKITSISEWIGAIFTGEAFIEPSQACETQLYNIHSHAWSEQICAYYGIDPAILPRICSGGSAAADILPEYRSRFHMKKNAVFIVGGADTQAALYQAGLKVGELAVVSGTTSPVVTLMKMPLYDQKQRVWVDAWLKGGSYQIEMNPGITGLNYQRVRSLLMPEWSYERLEEAYKKKNAFGCTASFSTLSFSAQKTLCCGGFFMKTPFDASLDRVDLLWAVLADIACAISLQLQHLSELTGNRAPYLSGCGGGFQSPALSQMLADLSGRELRLRSGYSQATVQGVIALCNEAFHVFITQEAEDRVYIPERNQMIHAYYPVWLRNRNSANHLEQSAIE